MPILAGEEVVGYIIRHNDSKTIESRAICYSTDYAKPVSLPIYGQYDDYGGIEGYEKTIAAKLASTGLKIPVKELVRKLERGEAAPYGLVMVHKPIHDGLVAFMQQEMNEPNYYGGKFNLTYEDIESRLSDDAEMEKLYAVAKKSPTKENLAKTLEASTKSFRRAMELSDGGYYTSGPDYNGLKEVYTSTKNSKSKRKLLEEYVRSSNDMTAFSRCVQYMRKTWLEPSGAGSQNQDFEYYLLLADLMRKQAFKSMGDSPEDTAYIYKTLLKAT